VALRSLIFGIQHSNFLDIGTKREMHTNGLLGEGKIDSFYLDIRRIIDSFYFSIVPVGTLGVNISSYGRCKFLSFGVDQTARAV